jgi:hypothetical protein
MENQTAIGTGKFCDAAYQAIFVCTLATSAATMAATEPKKATVTVAKKIVIMVAPGGLLALRDPH